LVLGANLWVCLVFGNFYFQTQCHRVLDFCCFLHPLSFYFRIIQGNSTDDSDTEHFDLLVKYLWIKTFFHLGECQGQRMAFARDSS
jgi:hypothetical protein